MKTAGIAAGILICAVCSPARGQRPPPEPTPRAVAEAMTRESFANRAARAYSGSISWTWNTGSAVETAEIGVNRGQIHCDVTYTTSEGTFSVSGPGMIDISLGLPPDEDAPADKRKGKWYSFRVACPSAAPDAPPGAQWAHSQDTYKQPGGEVGLDGSVPDTLRGSWNAQTEDGGEHTTMTWRLCKVGCLPPPKKP